MLINVHLYSINLYDTSTALREHIHYEPIYIVIAVFTMDGQYSLETSAFEELRSEFINLAYKCVINTLRLIVYLTGFSI